MPELSAQLKATPVGDDVYVFLMDSAVPYLYDSQRDIEIHTRPRSDLHSTDSQKDPNECDQCVETPVKLAFHSTGSVLRAKLVEPHECREDQAHRSKTHGSSQRQDVVEDGNS